MIQSYPTTSTCSDVTERSMGSPRMGGISVGVASTVVDNAEARLEKYTQNTFNCGINTKIWKCICHDPVHSHRTCDSFMYIYSSHRGTLIP